MRRALVAAVVLGGCNGLFGLDATSPESADADHDGVEDGLDHCRGVANPGQEDCEVVGGGGTDILVSFANAPVHIQLAMSVASRLTYVDLVR